jgi:hypothetical protein
MLPGHTFSKVTALVYTRVYLLSIFPFFFTIERTFEKQLPLRESGDKGSPTNVPDGSAGGRGGEGQTSHGDIGTRAVQFDLSVPGSKDECSRWS